MKLNALLIEHQKFTSSVCLRRNLGDGFLLQHNSVFRLVREEALRTGVGFTADRFFDYDALALTQLPKILQKKTVPYCDNVRPLKEIEKSAPGIFSWSELPPLRANYILHETAHALARPLRIKYLGKQSAPKGIDSERELALAILIEEAYANACESLANADSDTSIHDEFLYKNSYVMEKEPARKSMRWAIDRFGSEVTFRILFFSFLHANFTRIQLEAIPFETILGLAFLGAEASKPKSDREIKQLKTVFRIGFDLDPAFTLFTNAFCLRLMGVKHEFMDLLDFHFLEFFEQKKYRNLLCAMSQLFQPKADDPRKGIQHVQ